MSLDPLLNDALVLVVKTATVQTQTTQAEGRKLAGDGHVVIALTASCPVPDLAFLLLLLRSTHLCKTSARPQDARKPGGLDTSEDVPSVLGSMAKLATGDAGRKAEIADGDLLVDVCVGKVVRALGHGTNKDANALIRVEPVDVAPDVGDRGVEAESNLAALGRQMLSDRVVDDSEQFLLRVGRPDR